MISRGKSLSKLGLLLRCSTYSSADRSEGSQELERVKMVADDLSLTVTTRDGSIRTLHEKVLLLISYAKRMFEQKP